MVGVKPDWQPPEGAPASLLGCGFAGEPPLRKDGTQAKGIYTAFAEAGGAVSYDRAEVRAEIARLISPRGADERGVVILAWARCGFATKARAALREREVLPASGAITRRTQQARAA